MRRRAAWAVVASAALALGVPFVAGGSASGAAPPPPVSRPRSTRTGAAVLLTTAPSGGPSAASSSFGYRVPDPSAYATAKAQAATSANGNGHNPHSTTTSTSTTTAPTTTTSTSTTSTTAPTTTTSTSTSTTTTTTTTPPSGGPQTDVAWTGQADAHVAPPDSTGAIGPGAYIELVNDRYGVYDRSGTLLSQGTMNDWTFEPTSEQLSDPQVLWDPASQRFYYVVLDVSNNHFAWGYSSTSTPHSAADFCHYDWNFGFGSTLPDYPKMGDMAGETLVGVNEYASGIFYTGSDVLWMGKPAAGATGCPTVSGGGQGGLTNTDGTSAFTPVPAVQSDRSSNTGWVVATHDVSSGTTSNSLTVFPVSTGAGGPSLGAPTSIGVGSFKLPANAPQPGTGDVIDTLDGRLTQAVSGLDPRVNAGAVWTSHTIAAGAGAGVRWYELDPSAGTVLQTGTISSSAVFAFNGAVSPDRADSGATAAFGSDMVLGFSTSSTSADPAIDMVSKVGANAVSPWTLVYQSPAADTDFTCSRPYGPPCRWGDYSGATPDPSADHTAASGRVWLANQWTAAKVGSDATDWRTRSWEATP